MFRGFQMTFCHFMLISFRRYNGILNYMTLRTSKNYIAEREEPMATIDERLKTL
jgi:hypothetical protein